ncbi:MAG: HmuY family protein [Flavobacteriaceae bacterium]
MKTIKILSIITLFFAFSSCSSDDDTITALPVESELIQNLNAPQEGGQGQPVYGEFTKFNFATGQTTTSDTNWDIALRGTIILINGGVKTGIDDEPNRTGNAAAYIANGTMSSVTSVDASRLREDSENVQAIPTGSGTGWYLYAGAPTHLITPIAGKILVFKTNDGKYAKMEILSYYKDAPANPDAFQDLDKYYTFNYIYQPNEGELSF